MKKLIILILLAIPGLVSAFRPGEPTDFSKKLSQAAIERTQHTVRYDGRYRKTSYPNGDVPDDRGVCTDVIIRTYRMFGIDLQKEVHEDMQIHFDQYPNKWGLSKPDKNIDHRRVPNLMVFFSRHGRVIPISDNPADYLPGDIVCWDLGGEIPHIGIVADILSQDGKRNMIVHNIGTGQVLADCLFEYRIIGHYRYGK